MISRSTDAGIELRIVDRPLHQRDIRDVPLCQPPTEDLQHLRLQVVGEHAARRPDACRQPFGDEPRAGADVGD
jgi:hypothetical protein